MSDLATRAATEDLASAVPVTGAETPRNVYGFWDTAGIHPARPEALCARVDQGARWGDEDGDERHG
jgi:hypothetical protein